MGNSKIQEIVKKQVHILISGVVQGVFFRATAVRIAQSLGLTGIAQNLPNGAVELIAEGEEVNLKKLLDWSQIGPSGARVDRVEIQWKDATESFDGFRMR